MRFVLLYGLAYTGGVIGYLPLLSFLLPMKVEAVTGELRLGIFTACLVAGAVAASLSNILFGWLSDRSLARGGGRRRWIAGGLIATAFAYAGFAAAADPVAIIVSVACFQTAINMALAPLFAIMADEIPDAQKGVAGGLLALGYPVAAGVAAAVLRIDGLSEAMRLAIVFAALAACIVPLMLTPARHIPEPVDTPLRRQMLEGDLAIAWGARILVQIAGAVLSLYLLYYFESLSPDPQPGLPVHVSHVLMLAYLVPVPVAILIGRISDRIGRRKPFLLGLSVLTMLGLIGMALATGPTAGALTFGAYAAGSATFLALHSAFAMQLLPSPRHRGRDLGLLNLTNTLPSLIGPIVTWSLATPDDFDAALLALAGLALCGGLLVLRVRGRR
ncbi:MFS transporter [Stakelama saccharophila]|uniref:MFS transporter n=1 Tax=Stakelama saccharophila TaxID=3075605 RepID=A0ABZ0BAB9_9SPHN|nr:MFS transporter [Stakelama sp. W311]WNO54298.1 MFS transporter [Stakelama sp. W311]